MRRLTITVLLSSLLSALISFALTSAYWNLKIIPLLKPTISNVTSALTSAPASVAPLKTLPENQATETSTTAKKPPQINKLKSPSEALSKLQQELLAENTLLESMEESARLGKAAYQYSATNTNTTLLTETEIQNGMEKLEGVIQALNQQITSLEKNPLEQNQKLLADSIEQRSTELDALAELGQQKLRLQAARNQLDHWSAIIQNQNAKIETLKQKIQALSLASFSVKKF